MKSGFHNTEENAQRRERFETQSQTTLHAFNKYGLIIGITFAKMMNVLSFSLFAKLFAQL